MLYNTIPFLLVAYHKTHPAGAVTPSNEDDNFKAPAAIKSALTTAITATDAGIIINYYMSVSSKSVS